MSNQFSFSNLDAVSIGRAFDPDSDGTHSPAAVLPHFEKTAEAPIAAQSKPQIPIANDGAAKRILPGVELTPETECGISNVASQIGAGMADQLVNHVDEVFMSGMQGLVVSQLFTMGMKVARVPTIALAAGGAAWMAGELVENVPHWARDIGIAYNPIGMKSSDVQAAEARLNSLGRSTINFVASTAGVYPGFKFGEKLLTTEAGKAIGGYTNRIGIGENSTLTRNFDRHVGSIQSSVKKYFSGEAKPSATTTVSQKEVNTTAIVFAPFDTDNQP